MFAKAYQIASAFTFPMLIKVRYFDSSVEAKLASITVLNAAGWAATAAHTLRFRTLYPLHRVEVSEYLERQQQILGNQQWNFPRKQRELAHLKANPKWVVEESIHFGNNQWSIAETALVDFISDLALIRLQPFDANCITQYPLLKNPHSLLPGTSLCKLGYPFMREQARIDEEADLFTFEPGNEPGPCYPMEGIFTQAITVGARTNSNTKIQFIETSTPNLDGQSGGPVVDVNGVLWGILCKNNHVEMAFSNPEKSLATPQYLHLGWAVHPSTLASFLREHHIAFEQSEN